MIKNNFLLLVDNPEIVKELSNYSSLTFLYPIADLCVGFNNYFDIKNLPKPGYILINRTLDNEALNKTKKIISKLPKYVKGIFFSDIGILNILKQENINISRILYLNHMNTNYVSVNSYLNDLDSVVLSTDITINETKEIIKKAKKPLVLFIFGHVNIMYSRRTLLSNYNHFFNEKVDLSTTIIENVSKTPLKLIENEYGTVVYTNNPFNALELLEEPALFYLINTIFLSITEIKDILFNRKNLNNKYPYKYLSTEETIFKVKENNK